MASGSLNLLGFLVFRLFRAFGFGLRAPFVSEEFSVSTDQGL